MNWRVTDAVLEDLGALVAEACGEAVVARSVAFGELTVEIGVAQVLPVLTRLRDEPALRFQQLIDICGADYPERPKRFEVVYHLLSLVHNRRIRVKVRLGEGESLASVVDVFPVADWFEREAFDMYGMMFEGHPDLRRILTDYGFEGHPLRKDFPMTGYLEVRYDDELKRVVYEPVKSVEYRNWDALSPWEGADYARPGGALPGDEKAGGGA